METRSARLAIVIGDLCSMFITRSYIVKVTSKFTVLVQTQGIEAIISLLDLFIRQRTIADYALAMQGNQLRINGTTLVVFDVTTGIAEIFADSLFFGGQL